MILSRQVRCHQSPRRPQNSCPAYFALHSPQHSSGIPRGRLTARVANPRHNTDTEAQGDGSWDEVQNFTDQGNKQAGGLTLPFELPYQNDRPKSPEKLKADFQESLDKTKQDREAKTEQSKKERQQRQKQKERDKDEAEKREKERKEKERKEKEKRKKFREQALMGGSLFGVSALTFGKWQLFASLGAVVFRTIGGPTLLSSVLRTPGYIIGRGMRVVEWDVTESPTGPTGHLVSMKLRALTPDGIRIAIAKEYGLSNYREVRQVSHWVTTTTPYFFEPMRTAATFKMLPDPAFVVWSKHPPTGAHKLPTRSSSPQSADTSSQDPLEGLAADQVTALMLKTISGVAAASRLRPRSGGQMAADSDSSRQHFNGSGSRSAQAAPDRQGTAAAMDNASEASEEDFAHSPNGNEGDEPTRRTQHLFHRSSKESAEDAKPTGYQSERDVLSDNHGSSRQQDARGSQKEADDSQKSSEQKNAQDGQERSGEDGSQKSSEQKNAQDGQERSGEDEVAGTLHGEADTNEQSSEESATEAHEPQLWSEPSVLQCLCDSPSFSADTWGERLELPDEFVCCTEDEEDCMVMAACTEMLRGDINFSKIFAYTFTAG
ncbi:hypothetical protein WJX82_004483 [Trebouxia sp. C0006]